MIFFNTMNYIKKNVKSSLCFQNNPSLVLMNVSFIILQDSTFFKSFFFAIYVYQLNWPVIFLQCSCKVLSKVVLDPQKKLRIAASFSILCKSLIRLILFFSLSWQNLLVKLSGPEVIFLWEGFLVPVHFLSNHFLLTSGLAHCIFYRNLSVSCLHIF